MNYDHPNMDLRQDSDNDVKLLFESAKQRREAKMKYRLLSELLAGNTIDVTKNAELFEALNRERMDFEQILKLHPEEVNEVKKYVKERKVQQGGRWYNKDSQAWWGEKGVIPPCCYYARPRDYWKDKKLQNKFWNDFPIFRIAEGKL